MTNTFKQLAAIDCSSNVEKKGNFSYLSWAWAVKEVGVLHPNWSFNVVRFDGLPFLKSDLGYFVEVETTINEVTHSELLPVLNHQNKPIPTPSTFDINTSIKRCLVKSLALHGLGLYIYAGEDLPSEDLREPFTADEKEAYDSLVLGDKPLDLYEFLRCIGEQKQMALYNSFAAGEKVANKAKCDALERDAIKLINDSIAECDEAAISGDDQKIREFAEDFGSYIEVKKIFFGGLKTETKGYVSQLLKQKDAA